MTNKKRRTGFTIVELVIVIAVIAILAAILIPTFVSITKKANLTADMVAVKEMNTILAAEEITDGKPATVVDAQEVLKSNGINDFTPMSSNNVFYWVGTDNRVILWEWENDEKTTGKVTYPDEYAKKYEDITSISVDWYKLGDDNGIDVIEATDGKTLEEAFIEAMVATSVEKTNYLMFPKNSEITLNAEQIGQFNGAMETDLGIGKNVHINLNGSTLNAEREDTIFNVPSGATLEFNDGNMNVVSSNYNHAGFQVQTGGSLVLRNVQVKGLAHTMIFPSSEASEVIIDNSNIECDAYYGLMTNGLTSKNIRIVINNSSIKNIVDGGGVGLLINCLSNVHINNSNIMGSRHALVMRSGTVDVKDSILEIISTNPSIFNYKDFAPGYGFSGYWKDGNKLPAGVLVLGDYSAINGDGTFSYFGDVTGTLTNTRVNSTDPNKIPDVLLASSDPNKEITLNYEGTTIDNYKIYGEDWTPTSDNVNVIICNKGPIKVNGVEK